MIDGVIEFLSGDTRSIVRDARERRCATQRPEERFEDAARYRNRLFAIESLAERQARRPAGCRHGRRDRSRRRRRSRRRPGVPAPRRAADRPVRLPPRERRRPGSARRSSSRSASSTTAATPERAAAGDRSGRRWRRRRRSRASSPTCVARQSRCARRCAGRRSALPSSRPRTRGSRWPRDASASEQKRLRRVEALEQPARGAQPREPAGADRVLRHLEPAGPGDRRVDVGLRRRAAEARSLPLVRACAGSTARTTSPPIGAGGRAPVRAAAGRATGRYDESFAADPEPRRDRRRQGAARGGARGDREVGVELPRVAVVALAKREEEVFVPGRADPIRLDRHDAGLQLLQRIRDEAHRFAIGHHRQPPRHARVRVDLRHARRRRPGAPPGDPAPLRLGRALPGGVAGRARGRAGPPGEDGARGVRAAPQERAALRSVARSPRRGCGSGRSAASGRWRGSRVSRSGSSASRACRR